MFENPRRGRQAKNFSTNVPKILDLKSSSEQIFSKICRWVPMTLNRFLFVSNTVEALLTDTFKGGRLYLYGHLHKTPFFSTSAQTLYFYVTVSDQHE